MLYSIMKIIGDYHMHTRFSDGKDTVIEMTRAAKEKGLSEIAITDHVFGHFGAGVRRRNFENLRGQVESARGQMPVLLGLESNLTSSDGRIDVDKEMRKDLDILLFGVHIRVLYSFGIFLTFLLPNLFWQVIHWTPKGRVRKNTKIIQRAIEKNDIDIWTHPNLYAKVDVVEVARTCVDRNTLIELNGKRIKFRPIDFERMLAVGAKFIIGSDAHSTKRIADTERVEEFLKNCDYDENDIINLVQSYTEYRKPKKEPIFEIFGRDKKRNRKKENRKS